ncbi:MAG: hypothetical protein Q7U04_09875 [Bacteriovorax sp.]|nr:hypothetical protein [Bacteriovorax sp.]
MTAAQIHLAFNHFPIAGSILALIILVWGFLVKRDQIKIVGIALVIISSLSAFVVMQTGDGAEEIVEHKPMVTKGLIHEHEEAADSAMIAIQLTAVLGIAWLVMYRLKKDHKEKIFAIMLLTNLASAALVANAAHKGGQIRHDEIRNETNLGSSNQNEKNDEESKEKEEKENMEKNEAK